MEGAQAAAGGGGGPAPFLLKTYDMVDDSTTDDIVSWSPSRKSFVVWNPPEFARILLPTYFKHNNFSSFIRQLNTYGFRKTDPERWEFANEDFLKDQKHLLKNIHRRKPIHSHSNPQGTTSDPERAAFEEEIDKLMREKSVLEGNLIRFRQQQSTAKLQLEDLTQRVSGMEQRQENLLSFLEKSVQSPPFVERLSQKLESMDVSAYNKKRRLPQVDHSQSVQENLPVDYRSNSKPEFLNIFHQDFCDKLRLELPPSVSDINLISHSTQSSNEEVDGPQRRIPVGWTKETPKPLGPLYATETLELSDTGTSSNLRIDSSQSLKIVFPESPGLHSLSPCLTSLEEGDGLVSCQLNLTLASSPFPAVKSHSPPKTTEISHDADKDLDASSQVHVTVAGPPVPTRNRNPSADDSTLSSLQNNKQVPAPIQGGVNDGFWEQFLTERPGSTSEEACSSFRAHPYDETENKKSVPILPTNIGNADHLSL